MSKNIRPVRVEWGMSASLFVDPEKFEDLVLAIMGENFEYYYRWNEADELFKFWSVEGSRFLDCVRDCQTDKVKVSLDESIREDAVSCLENMKSMEPEWRTFLDKEGALELWVDGF